MRLLVMHTLELGISEDRVTEILRSAMSTPDIRPYRSFLNLADGKGVCLFDAPDRECLIRWLDENKLPYDAVWTVEFEADKGERVDVPTVSAAGAGT